MIDARVSSLAEVTHSTRDAARVPGNEEGKGKGDPIPAYILGHRHACVCVIECSARHGNSKGSGRPLCSEVDLQTFAV